MVTKAQILPNRRNTPKIELCSTLSLSKPLPCVVFCEAGSSTTVEDSLQISSFMQNKPNFLNAQMNVTFVLTKDYENNSHWTLGENKPNTNPIQTQSNPIAEKVKLMQTLYLQRIMKKNADMGYEKTNPIQTQSNPISKQVHELKSPIPPKLTKC